MLRQDYKEIETRSRPRRQVTAWPDEIERINKMDILQVRFNTMAKATAAVDVVDAEYKAISSKPAKIAADCRAAGHGSLVNCRVHYPLYQAAASAAWVAREKMFAAMGQELNATADYKETCQEVHGI